MLQTLNLRMFDGEGGGSAAGTADSAPVAANNNVSLGTVLGGAGADQPVQAQKTETREQRFAKMVGKDGEYRDLYDARVKRAVTDRMRAATAREQAVQPILDTLAQAYGTDDLAELQRKLQTANEIWEAGADAEGLTVEQYRQMQQLRMQQRRFDRERAEAQRMAAEQAKDRQIAQWQAEAQDLQAVYPGFDLEVEMGNPTFQRMVTAGASIRNAYEVLHLDEIKAQTAAYTARQTERKVSENIRARGARPAENGVVGSAGPVVKNPANLTAKERKEIRDYMKAHPGARIPLM